MLDYDEIRDLAVRERPRMIIAGATAYSRIIDFEAFRAIADEVGALLLVDAAHIAGLDRRRRAPVAGSVRRRRHVHDAQDAARPARRRDPQPRSSTRPRSTRRCSPGLQGGPLMHVIAAKAVAFREASAAVVPPVRGRRRHATRRRSPAALADEGFRIVSGGTDNHLMLVDLRPFGVTGKVAQEALDRAGHHLQQERDPERPREAVRHERAAARHRVVHDRGHGCRPRCARSRR